MKKLFLLGAIAMMAAGAQAQDFTDLFKVTYNGQELKDGDEIVVNKCEFEDWGGWGEYAFEEVNINVESLTGETTPIFGKLSYSVPTQDVMKADRPRWGSIQFCYQNAVNQPGNCLSSMTPGVNGEGYVNIPVEGTTPAFVWQLHRDGIEELNRDDVSEFELFMVACEGDASVPNGVEEGDAYMVITLKYGANLASVSDLNAAADGKVEYYSLDGRKLNAPAANGIYLKKANGKVSKHIAR